MDFTPYFGNTSGDIKAYEQWLADEEIRKQTEFEEQLRREQQERERQAVIANTQAMGQDERQKLSQIQSGSSPSMYVAEAPQLMSLSSLADKLQNDPRFIRYATDAEVQRVLAEEQAKKQPLVSQVQQKLTGQAGQGAANTPSDWRERFQIDFDKEFGPGYIPLKGGGYTTEAAIRAEKAKQPGYTETFQGYGKYATPLEFWANDPGGFNAANPQLAMRVAQAGAGLPPSSLAQLLELYDPQMSPHLRAEKAYNFGAQVAKQRQAMADEELKRRQATVNYERSLLDLQGAKSPVSAYEKKRQELKAEQEHTAAMSAIPGSPENERVKKANAAEEKAYDRYAAAQDQFSKVGGFLKQAQGMVSGSTAGWGSLLAGIPSTSAKDLSKVLASIKANIGFDKLQKMREESPTGGALGQVAVQELNFLQSVEGSLDQDQSPEQLRANLQAISESYQRLMDDLQKNPPDWVGKRQAQQPQQPQQPQPRQAPNQRGSKADWMVAAKKANPGMSGAQLEAEYMKRYGTR